MPLSNEEAQQLIAEIDNLDTKYCPGCAINISYDERCHIKKIIKRFENKQSELYVDFFFKEASGDYSKGACDMGFNEKSNDYYINLPGRCNNERMIFERYQLEMLRDNCTKMLEWLNDA